MFVLVGVLVCVFVCIHAPCICVYIDVDFNVLKCVCISVTSTVCLRAMKVIGGTC